MKARKKPVIIDTMQWTGENAKEIIDFTGRHKSVESWPWEMLESFIKEKGLKIFTLEGKMSADIGDYIIKGVNGEFYPCKPDIFHKTYDIIEENTNDTK